MVLADLDNRNNVMKQSRQYERLNTIQGSLSWHIFLEHFLSLVYPARYQIRRGQGKSTTIKIQP